MTTKDLLSIAYGILLAFPGDKTAIEAILSDIEEHLRNNPEEK